MFFFPQCQTQQCPKCPAMIRLCRQVLAKHPAELTLIQRKTYEFFSAKQGFGKDALERAAQPCVHGNLETSLARGSGGSREG